MSFPPTAKLPIVKNWPYLSNKIRKYILYHNIIDFPTPARHVNSKRVFLTCRHVALS